MNLMAKNKKEEKGVVRSKKNFLDDRRIRLALSVLGAIISWMIVTMVVQPGTSTVIYNVPVDYTYDTATFTSRGLTIVGKEDRAVNLKISGDGYTIGSLTASDFVVYPDWSGVRESGAKNLRLRVRSANGMLNNVSVTLEGSDNTVNVVFDVEQQKELEIKVTDNYLSIKEGYILFSTNSSKETVTLTGPSSELSKVATCTAEVISTGELSETITQQTKLRFYNASGKEVEFEYTKPDEEYVDVTLEVYKLATIPIDITFINTPRNFDVSVLPYELSSKQIRIAGPEDKIDKFTSLSVGTIDLSTFAMDKQYNLQIELPNEIYLLDNISTVTVSFDCSGLTTKTINLPDSCVQVVHLPSAYKLTVETERLMNVVLCGPVSAMESLTPEQVVIEIDADDFSVTTGQQNIACKIYVPANGKIFALGSYQLQCRIENS